MSQIKPANAMQKTKLIVLFLYRDPPTKTVMMGKVRMNPAMSRIIGNSKAHLFDFVIDSSKNRVDGGLKGSLFQQKSVTTNLI